LTEAVSLLFPVFGSNWSAWLTDAVFATGFGLTTRLVMVSVAVAPTASVPTVQIPVAGS
jgi:hypothetical protein